MISTKQQEVRHHSSNGFTQSDKEHEAALTARYKQFFGRGENRYMIYPDYWKESWGKAPLLGIVFADNEFLAERLAYDRGILNPNNRSFGARIKNLGPNRNIPQPNTTHTR